MIEINKIPSPSYVLDEALLRKNLALIRSVKERSGVNIILAFKTFALWKSFPIVKEYITQSTASSPWEAQLAWEEMGSKAHTYSPAYTEKDFPVIKAYSSHITFNSLSQFNRFYPETLNLKPETLNLKPETRNLPLPPPEGDNPETHISCGLRINPEYSEVTTDLYNPAAPGSRLGLIREELGDHLPEGVEGLHFHTLCESTSYALENTLKRVESQFGDLLPQIRWLNMGGGHLITDENYDVEHLIQLLQNFRKKYPHLEIILEPGAAFVWQTGVLVSTVVDIVQNRGISTAILDVSFTCHMPDCLEMPYKPVVRCAFQEAIPGKPTYRLGGNSCLSGDYIGDWSFDQPLKTGDRIVFEDMIHYTIVKTNFFNGIPHPDLCLWRNDNTLEIYRRYCYEDYKNRMS